MSAAESEIRSVLDQEIAGRGLNALDAEVARRGLNGPPNAVREPLEAPQPRSRVAGGALGLAPPAPVPGVVVKAAEHGIEFSRPAPDGHFVASLAIDERNRQRAYELALTARFGEQAQVRIGPETGELEYFDPGSRRFTLIAPPGADLADIQGLAGAAITLVPEMVFAGAAAIFTKHPALVETGAGAGAFAGELTRLYLGQKFGINEVPDEDIIKRAATVAGFAAAGGVVANKIMKAGRFMLDTLRGRVVPKDAARILQTDVQSAQQAMDEINDRIGSTEFRLNLAQASGDEDLLVMQDIFRRSPEYSAQFREFGRDQEAALRLFYDTINKPYRSRLTPAQTGERVKGVAESRVARETARADEFVRRKQADLEELLRGLHTKPLESLGRPIRDLGDAEQTAFRRWADDAARALNDVAGNEAFIDNAATFAVVQNLDRKSRSALIPLLERQSRALIGTNDVVREVAGDQVIEVPARKIFDPKARFTFDEAWSTVSALKRIERIAGKGLSTESPEVGQVRALYTALERDMKAGMDGSSLRTEYERFVRRYALEKRRLDQGAVASVMERTGGQHGRYRIADEKVFASFFTPGTKRDAQELFELMQHDVEMLDSTRKAIVDFWQRSVVQDGRVNLSAHQQWLNRYGDTASVFMNKAEMRMLIDPANAERALQAREKARKRALDGINRTFEAELTRLNPSRIAPLVMDRSNPGRAVQVAEMLRETPDILRAVRHEVRKEIGERIAGQYKNGERFFSPARLDEFLNGKGGEKGFRENLTNVFGREYVDDMDKLNEAIKLVAREPQFPNRSNTAFWSNTLKNLGRAYVGLFTRPGRVITAVDRLRGRAANRVMARALLNPEDLNTLIRAGDQDMREQGVAAFIGAMGGTALLADFEPGTVK